MKRDYFHEFDAPAATRLWPVVNVAVHDVTGRLLLIERADDGYWALPGGLVDVGETFTEAAVREVREETGYTIQIASLLGLYSDPGHVTAFPDGTVSQQCSLLFTGKQTGGRSMTSIESRQVAFVDQGDVLTLRMHPAMRLRVEHGFAAVQGHREQPYLG